MSDAIIRIAATGAVIEPDPVADADRFEEAEIHSQVSIIVIHRIHRDDAIVRVRHRFILEDQCHYIAKDSIDFGSILIQPVFIDSLLIIVIRVLIRDLTAEQPIQ